MSTKSKRPRGDLAGTAKLKALRKDIQKGLDSGPSRPLNMGEVKRLAQQRLTPDCHMASVRRHPLAVEDLIGIWVHLVASGTDAPAGADGFLDALDRDMHFLAASPDRGRRRPGEDHALYTPLSGYLIAYRLADDGIEVVRILRNAPDIRALFPDGQ